MMSWVYAQSSGALRGPSGALVCLAYSGHGPGMNNPGLQETPDVGPIPCGDYQIGPAEDLPHLGPCAMALTPLEHTDTFGREGFYCHGDNAAMNHTASCGCIVAAPDARASVNASPDKILRVIT